MVSAPFQVTDRSPEVPRLLIQLESRPRVFANNIADFLLRRGPRGLEVDESFWPDVFVSQRVPVAAMRQSLLWHVFVIVAIWGFTVTWLNRPHVKFETFSAKQTVSYYPLSEYLPQIGTPTPLAPIARKGEPEFSPQPVISVPRLPDNTRQTIVDPSTVKILSHDAKLPNLVAWNNIPSAPVTAETRTASQLTLPWHTPTPVAPAAENTNRKISELAEASVPSVVQPALSGEALKRKLGDMNIAEGATALAPKLEVPVQRASGSEVAAKPTAPAAPDLQGVSGSGAHAAGQLIALNVRPQAPTEPIQPPGGNRSGIFAATPEGKPGAPGTPDIAAGSHALGGASTGQTGTSNVPAGIYVGPPAKDSSTVAGKSSLSADQQKKILMAGLQHSPPLSANIRTTPPAIEGPKARIEDEVFGTKKYYSMILNMPNLTSGGGSWIVRYAELKETPGEGALSAPVAVQKVDPAYPAEAMRENVEGTVVLYAVIHSDGRVSDVRVLKSVDERLDASARAALVRWQFRPATKGGEPIALETVVHIPFALPKNGL